MGLTTTSRGRKTFVIRRNHGEDKLEEMAKTNWRKWRRQIGGNGQDKLEEMAKTELQGEYDGILYSL